jgi:hypothetical protein
MFSEHKDDRMLAGELIELVEEQLKPEKGGAVLGHVTGEDLRHQT